jgi:hypothetical protein
MSIENFSTFYAHKKHELNLLYNSNEFLYPNNCPWPEPSFDYPYGMGPEVNNIPKQELEDWSKYVGSYYQHNALGTSDDPTPFGQKGAEFAKNNFMKNGISGYASLTDEAFVDLLCEGLYSKFLCRLDPQDTELFGIRESAEYEYFKSDYSCMRVVKKTWPNEHAAPTIAIVRRKTSGPQYADEGAYELVAIALAKLDKPVEEGGEFHFSKDMIFTAEKHGSHSAWWLVKYFVLQGAIHRINLIDHVRVHFPTDPINAVTKSVLPEWHLLHQLLIPHFWLHLPVDNAVLEGERSLINRNSWYPWSPFVAKGDEIRRLLPYSWAGEEFYSDDFNSSYLHYHFSLDPDSVPDPRDPENKRIPTFIGLGVSRYGKFLREYFDPILAYTTDVVTQLPPPPATPDAHEDATWLEIQHWAYEISKFMPGFPNEREICEGDNLARALAVIIWNDSICHSGDHGALHKMMDDSPVPFVLRVPPPSSTSVDVEEKLSDALGEEGFKYLKEGIHQMFNLLKKSTGLPHIIENFIEKHLESYVDKMELKEGTIPLCWPTDLVYAKMADLLFYRPHNCSLLYDCQYEFLIPEEQKSEERRKLEKSWEELGRPLLSTPQKEALKAARMKFQGLLDEVNLKYYNEDGSPIVESPFFDDDTAAQLNKYGFPKLRPGTSETDDSKKEAAIRMQACIGAGVQY